MLIISLVNGVIVNPVTWLGGYCSIMQAMSPRRRSVYFAGVC